jgi:hypothetical protein
LRINIAIQKLVFIHLKLRNKKSRPKKYVFGVKSSQKTPTTTSFRESPLRNSPKKLMKVWKNTKKASTIIPTGSTIS